MHVIIYFVPESHLDITKNALFKKGAGKYSNYDSCSWETKGNGQFRPLDGSIPYSGKAGKLEITDEYRVEMICEDGIVKAAIQELLRVHPYEEPAYYVYRILKLSELNENL
jgi:hypothetical protein